MEHEGKQELLEREKVIFSALEDIDELLDNVNIRLRTRPLHAAIFFVEEFVVEVSHGSKENFADQKWFAIIFHHVKDWYQQTYGTQMNENHDGFGRGVVSIRGVPVALKVPFTRSVVEEEGISVWLCFPNKIEKTESPRSWLEKPPPLTNLKPEDLKNLKAICAQTAIALRNINLNIQGLSSTSETFDGFISGILPEIEAASSSILANTTSSFRHAAWSIQMALELTLKAMALQKTGRFIKTHNLFAIFDEVSMHLSHTNRDVMKSFLRVNDVMDARYGQGNMANKKYIFDAFLACIELIATVSQKFERKMTISGGRILLKKPPWISLPK